MKKIWRILLKPYYPDCLPANLVTLLGNGLFVWFALYYVTHLQFLMHDINKEAFWVGSILLFATVDDIRRICILIGKWIFHVSNKRKIEKADKTQKFHLQL